MWTFLRNTSKVGERVLLVRHPVLVFRTTLLKCVTDQHCASVRWFIKDWKKYIFKKRCYV